MHNVVSENYKFSLFSHEKNYNFAFCTISGELLFILPAKIKLSKHGFSERNFQVEFPL